MENQSESPPTTLQLYLVTYDKAATVTVTVAKPRFNQTVYIDRDSSRLVTLNYTYMITEKKVTSKAVLVKSSVDISVFAFSSAPSTADAMSCLPFEDLGTKYYISTPTWGSNKQFAVANGLEETVEVNITTTGYITFNGFEYRKGQSFSFFLEYQQVIQFQSSEDLTATNISSSAPVAVFSGQKCFSWANTCDTLVEQLHPMQNWGNLFAVFPLLNHTQDSISIIAANPDTVISIEGELESKRYSLQEASYTRFPLSEMVIINSSQPIMVTYLLQEDKPNLVTNYDPFFVTVPPSLATRKFYKFVTQNTYYNFLLIVSQAASPEFYLDQHLLDFDNVSMKELNGFYSWEVSLGKTDGQHEIYHRSEPFTIYVYGIENYVSYGYSMGQETIYPDAPSTLDPPTENSTSQGILHCLSHGAEYQLPIHLLSEANLEVLDVHLEDPECRAELDGDFALIKIPFTGCGSDVLNEGEKTYYINTIYGTLPGTSIHRIEIPVTCEMETKETLDFSFQPKVTDVVSLGHYNVSLKLYQTGNFNDLVTTYPHEVDLHGSLHMEFKVESDDAHLQILVEKCKASPSLGESEQIYYLIQQGCSKDSTLQTHLVPDQRLQRFSFHVFKFDNFPEVYLSCNVIICHNGTAPNRCTQGCFTSRHRRDARSSKVQLASARLSQGPITIMSDQPQNTGTVPFSALMVVVGVMGSLTVLGLFLQKHHYRRRDYALLQDTSD
ncbi:IgGFc-binding protein-like [Bufo gargarizans]|uniref:IgGFc-binding protein-like n=1 Tax=Bufo gargarizans TaxID=30331 RepID=UPI001CF4E524|nr:IgGFc-binding protein-like [Bufo gargarizans]